MACSVFAISFAIIPGLIAGQVHPQVIAGDGCSDCLSFSQQLRLGTDEGDGYIVESRFVTVDDLGRYWVAQMDNVKIFSAEGQHVHTLGRAGQGPGEFQNALEVLSSPDGSVHVFDNGNGRRTIFSSDFSILDELRMPGPVFDARFLDGNERLIVLNARSSEPLHVMEVDGEDPTISFGRGSSEVIPQSNAFRRSITLRPGTVLVGRRNEYVIQEFNPTTGRELARWVRDAAWSSEPTRAGTLQRDSPPGGHLDAIHIDAKGRLWTFSWVPADDWQDHLVEKNYGGRMLLQPESNDAIFDTVVEVLDLESGKVIVTQRFSQTLHGFLNNGMAYGVTRSDLGSPVIDIWNISLELPTR